MAKRAANVQRKQEPDIVETAAAREPAIEAADSGDDLALDTPDDRASSEIPARALDLAPVTHSTPVVVVSTGAEPEQEMTAVSPKPLAKCCGTCCFWRPHRDDKSIGQCLPSARVLPAPLMTLDWGRCSKWEARQ